MAYRSHLDDPEYWRDRAEQVRALADQVSNQKARDAILRIAAEYELLADRAQERLSGHNPKRSGNASESVRKHQAGLQSFRSMRRIEARRKNASALRLRFSQSLASLRQRLSQAKVRSTTQRRGSTTNPFVRSERLTISVSS